MTAPIQGPMDLESMHPDTIRRLFKRELRRLELFNLSQQRDLSKEEEVEYHNLDEHTNQG